MNTSKLWFVQCLSPVHIGAGQGVGIIDMPIIRERTSEWPFIPGSSMKGVQRECFKRKGRDDNWLNAAFGKAGDKEGNAGAFVISDGRLLAFPVASAYGTFAYVTCPMAIRRLIRDAAAVGLTLPDLDWNEVERIIGSNSREDEENVILSSSRKVASNGIVRIDEFQCTAVESHTFARWARWFSSQLSNESSVQQMLIERLVLVSDDTFQYFVTMCCEIIPRIRINSDTKTVESGAFWYEEYLPVESILYGIVWCDKIYGAYSEITEQGLLNELKGEMVMQIGGNTTIGKGLIRCCFSEEEAI